MEELYEIALSFAGEDRAFAEQIATMLRRRRVKVFYDEFELAKLWGKDLYQYIVEVYSSKSKYCLVIISKSYVSKPWPNHELKAAQSKQLISDSEYILPIRLDDSKLPGLLDTVGYIDARKYSIEIIVESIMEKIGRKSLKLFRGMDLGHGIDPLRSALAKMETSLFEDICNEILANYQFQTYEENDLTKSILAKGKNIGSGSIKLGLLNDTFTYAQQVFTEIGHGIDKTASRVLSQEVYSRDGGNVLELNGLAIVVTHSLVENIPTSENVSIFAEEVKHKGVKNIIFLINEDLNQAQTYFGVLNRILNEHKLYPVPLFLEDLAYQILTTDIFRKYESKLQWRYQNPL